MMRAPDPAERGGRAVALRLFIVGCPRSGTTILQRGAAARFGLYTLPETRFYAHLVGNFERKAFAAERRRRPPRLALTTELRERLRLGTGLQWSHVEFGPRHESRKWRSFGSESRVFLEMLDDRAREAGMRGWVEKTPDHVHYLDHIFRLAPSARVIHVLREARDVVASIRDAARRYDKPWGATFPNIERAVDRWNKSVADSARWCADEERNLFLRYEDFAVDAESVYDRIGRFLGVAPVSEEVGATPTRIAAEGERWKSAALSGPIAPADSKWDTALDKTERAQAEALIAPLPAALERRLGPKVACAESPAPGPISAAAGAGREMMARDEATRT